MLVEGRVFELASLIGMFITVFLYVQRTKKGLIPTIRRLPGLDAIDEGISRAAEMGKNVHFTGGYSRIIGLMNPDAAPQMLASVGILGYIAQISAKRGVKLITSLPHAELIPLYEEVIKTGYLMEGVPEAFDRDSIIYLSPHQFAYAIGVMEILNRQNVGANMMFGYFLAESLIFAEVGSIQNCFQVAGTGATLQLPFFVVTCDYTLLGEEIFAASAYVTKDPTLLGVIQGQDVIKIVTSLLTIIMLILTTLNIDVLKKLLEM